MTLGALGGQVKPLDEEQIRNLPPLFSIAVLGQVLGVSEPVVREQARRGRLDELGIRCLRIGNQWRIPRSDVWRFLGLDDRPGITAGERSGPDEQTGARVADLAARRERAGT